MNFTLLEPLLRQSYLHLLSYGLVALVLWIAIRDACLISLLSRALKRESKALRGRAPNDGGTKAQVHPAARIAGVALERPGVESNTMLQRKIDLAEASLFVPLRTRMALTRDLSTLMGLIATLLALVAAATDFAHHGRPELLIGSVGTGCLATCVAAVGCALALWNLSRLTRLRLWTAEDTETLLSPARQEADATLDAGEVPIRHVAKVGLNFRHKEAHAAV